ncbi:MAG: citrate lyase subunit beta / citryl-CoA lyase [Aliidongia sp.]|jgi:citrate lyase subunit beta/citryl-CoA lyase|nr:citrate lyase subunit beta / citryl-CoA lyase [Aliidongia sp.]
MPTDSRPRRSVLYMPGANARALDKARGLAADGLIFDLEDAVLPEAKPEARATVAAALAQGGYGRRERLLRVNGLDTQWGHDDLVAAAAMDIDGVVLPKIEAAATIRQTLAILDRAGARADLVIWVMMETPLAMLRAEEIAAASPRLAGLIMGTSDLANDLHAAHTRDRLPLMTGLGLCLLAARAYGLAILDGVYLDLADDEGFAQSCRQGVELGFDGKTLIHPKTIDAANAAFAPDAAAIAEARRFVAGFEAAQATGKGVVLVDGKLVESLHVANARRLVALADRIAALERTS